MGRYSDYNNNIGNINSHTNISSDAEKYTQVCFGKRFKLTSMVLGVAPVVLQIQPRSANAIGNTARQAGDERHSPEMIGMDRAVNIL
jgi:hypothetical protein